MMTNVSRWFYTALTLLGESILVGETYRYNK